MNYISTKMKSRLQVCCWSSQTQLWLGDSLYTGDRQPLRRPWCLWNHSAPRRQQEVEWLRPPNLGTKQGTGKEESQVRTLNGRSMWLWCPKARRRRELPLLRSREDAGPPLAWDWLRLPKAAPDSTGSVWNGFKKRHK